MLPVIKNKNGISVTREARYNVEYRRYRGIGIGVHRRHSADARQTRRPYTNARSVVLVDVAVVVHLSMLGSAITTPNALISVIETWQDAPSKPSCHS